MKKQYDINNNTLILKVKKAPLFVRFMMFFFAFSSFLLPLSGVIFGLATGKGLHIGYFIGLFIFGILGFYMLRIALWNTYGRENITFNDNSIAYLADYGWFRDGKKQEEIKLPIVYSINQIGYEEDNMGSLIIWSEEPIICVTKMSNNELEELIDLLKTISKH